MTLDIHNWSSSAHQEIFKIVKDEIYHIVNQVDAIVQNFKIQFLKEAAKFVRDFKSLANEVGESLAKHKDLEFEIEHLLSAVVTHKDMKQKIEWLQAQLGDQKGKSEDTSCVSDTLEPLSQKLENENVDLEFQGRQICPINKVRASVRTNPITLSQPHVITKKDVNSNSHGLSSIGVDNTAKTRRPQRRSNTKNDRVPSVSKSSCIKNKEVEVEEHHKNLLLSKNTKHMSSECNNIKLAIRNDKSDVVYAMCKQCLITSNHDVCVLKYVNDINSCGDKQTSNVSKIENQKKHKPKGKKPKNVGFKERLASPKPSKPRICLRWSSTRRMFDLKGEIISSSKSECQSDCSKGDNACTSNHQEPTSKRFPNSTFSLEGSSNLFMVHRLGVLKAYDRKSKTSHKFHLEVLGNRPLWK
ncbi:hypothetical protein Tco_0417209 [Tanacetum coccineum]